MADLTTAKAGMKLSARAQKTLAQHLDRRLIPSIEVHPKSEGAAGQWICINCGYVAAHNLDAYGHAEKHKPKSPHRFAWRNFENGGRLEEP